MHRKHRNLTTKSRYYKPNFLCWNTLNALLYYMIPILITNTSHNMSIQLSDKLCFLFRLNNLKCLQLHRIKVVIFFSIERRKKFSDAGRNPITLCMLGSLLSSGTYTFDLSLRFQTGTFSSFFSIFLWKFIEINMALPLVEGIMCATDIQE